MASLKSNRTRESAMDENFANRRAPGDFAEAVNIAARVRKIDVLIAFSASSY